MHKFLRDERPMAIAADEFSRIDIKGTKPVWKYTVVRDKETNQSYPANKLQCARIKRSRG